jgi:hypothetical protein
MVLRKSDILQGINDPKEIMIESLGDTLYLRPLSNAELDELDEIEAKGMESYETNSKSRGRIQGETISKGKLNIRVATISAAKARDRKIQMSLDNPKNEDNWSLEDIGKLRRDVANEIVDRINELSGVEVTEGDIDKFPEE